MGSPLGPSFANIFMCALEQNFLSNCPSNHKPIFYRSFVDDTFCIFQNRTQVECFLNYLNRQHPNIKFTQELEENNSLPFLDTLVTHVENGFNTNLYRKKTFTGLYTHFDSLSHRFSIKLTSFLFLSTVPSIFFRLIRPFTVKFARSNGFYDKIVFLHNLLIGLLKGFLTNNM